jgi:hypothetical protein
LAVVAPAASAFIAASGIGTVLGVAGGVVVAASTVQSVRQRDLWNNPISEEEANFNLGFGVGSVAGGALAKPVGGAGSALGKRLGQGALGLAGDIENLGMAGRLAPAGGPGAIPDEAPVLQSRGGGGGGDPNKTPWFNSSINKIKGQIPKDPRLRWKMLNSLPKDVLKDLEGLLEEGIPTRQAEQLNLGETNVTGAGSPTGAQHRVRIDDELDLLRMIRKILSGT